MKKYLKVAGIASILVGASCLLAALIARPVSAAVNESSMKKAYAGLLYRCYMSGSLRSPIENTNQALWAQDEFGEGNTLLTNTADNTVVLLPNGWTHATDDDVSCRELFLGEGVSDFAGINSTYGMPSDNKAALEKLGYEQSLTGIISAAKSCITPTFTMGTALEVNSNGWLPGGWVREGNLTNISTVSGPEICFDTNTNGTIAATGYLGSAGDNNNEMQFDVLFEGNMLTLAVATDGEDWHHSIEYTIGSTKPDDIKAQLSNALSSKGEIDVTTPERVDPDPITGRAQRTIKVLAYKSVDKKDQDTPNTGYYQFCNNSSLCAANKADANLFGSSNRAFTDGEITSLYMDYINRYTVYSCNENDTGIKKVKLKVDGTWKTCTITHAYKESFHGVDSAHIFGVSVSLDDIIEYLGKVDEDTEDVEDLDGDNNVGVTNPDPADPEAPKDDATDVCYGSPGTLGLSWILCPILAGTSSGLNYLYGEIEREYLQVQPKFIDTNSNTYSAWQTFQNIANVILVIFLLVVIFSQLTGIGIDNYGIKKILPRLIICAILVNLSYFIAQFLVDVSNIVGDGIRGLFGSVSPDVLNTTADGGGGIPNNILGFTVLAGATGFILTAVANPAVLLGLLLTIISGIFATLMLWVILIVRQAGVIVAVIIAPVAFALYLLPNTSKFTKSWGNLMKGLLIVYPLAGLLIGASFFVSSLLVGGNDGAPDGNMVLPAMILRVAPFFALPALFRKSVDAMGNLGTRIQGFGRTLSRGATGAMRNADWYKNAQERGIERRTRLRAGIDQNGNEATGWRGFLRSRSDRNRARYRSQYLKTQGEQGKADLLITPEYMEAMRQKQELDRQAERNEVDLMNSPDYRSALQQKQATELEKKQTEAQASAITTGKFKRSDGASVNTSSLDELRDALEFEASRDGAQDIGKIRALYDAILAKGDDGIDALGTVWDSGKLKGEGLNRIMENIASDGTIKSKARSLHATANDVMNPSNIKTYDTNGGQVERARISGEYASKIKPEMLSNMTDNERNNYIQYANSTSDSTAMRNIYLASQNINSFKPGEQKDVYDVADRYVQDHMELAKAGTYTYTDANGVNRTSNLRRDANNILVMDVIGPNGITTTTPVNANSFKSANFRLKRD